MTTDYCESENGFTSGDYDVRFLQDDTATVCLIAHIKRLGEIYTGVTCRNPKDAFNAATGRHKAFERAIKNSEDSEPSYWWDEKWSCVVKCVTQILPVKQLQRDYWKRYAKEDVAL